MTGRPQGNSQDEQWMARALALAEQSVGLASPNPNVGCVLVHGDQVVGEGFHRYEQRDHAEIVALKQAGDAARGSTAYVTLEPCSHHGRTGPCADALIAAGVSRVVAATEDPNPAVHGQGIARIAAAGIAVRTGVLAEQARRLNDAFARHIRTGQPFVHLKAALTLDGHIAPPPTMRQPGSPFWITGEASRAAVQRLRHASDAVITGVNTVLQDDPLLTDRTGLPRRRPLLRVVLDSQLRLPLETKLVRSAKDDLLVCCTIAPGERGRALEEAGVRVARVEANGNASRASSSRVSLPRVLELLAVEQRTSALVEAGTQVNTAFLEAGLVDRITLFYGPSLLGTDAVPLLDCLSRPLPKLQGIKAATYGNDVVISRYFNDPWQ